MSHSTRIAHAGDRSPAGPDAAGRVGRGDPEGPPVWPSLPICAGVAAWVALGDIHWQHSSDSLIPVLTSLYYWTPFYWDQNRVGMLVPLLAMPFAHPFVNLLVQVGLGVFGGLAAMFLLARYAVRDASWPEAATLGAATFLAFAPIRYQVELLLGHQPYAPALALCLGGLLLARPPRSGRLASTRLGAAAALVSLAHWVNIATVLVVGPLVVLRGAAVVLGAAARGPRPSVEPRAGPATSHSRLERLRGAARAAARGETGISLLLVAVGFSAGVVFMQSVTFRTTPTELTPLEGWPDGLRQLGARTWAELQPAHWPWSLGLAAGAGVLVLGLTGAGRRLAGALGTALVLMLAATAYGLAIASFRWVAENDFAFRYLMPSVLLLQTALAAVAVAPIRAALGPQGRRALYAAAFPLLLLAAYHAYGLPSVSRVRGAIDERFGTWSPDVVAARATFVAGAYWRVWPAVFHANLLLHERDEGRIVWGISLRSRPSWSWWRRIPREEVRVAVTDDDPMAYPLLRQYRVTPLVVVERRSSILVLRPPETLGPSETFLAPYPQPDADGRRY